MMENNKNINKKKVVKKGILGVAAVSAVYGAKKLVEFRKMAKRMRDQMDQFGWLKNKRRRTEKQNEHLFDSNFGNIVFCSVVRGFS